MSDEKKSGSTLQEIKCNLRELLNEAEDERSASSMAKQIIDQSEIQKLVRDRKKQKEKAKRAMKRKDVKIEKQSFSYMEKIKSQNTKKNSSSDETA